MHASNERAAPAGDSSLACLQVGGQIYGVDVRQVREVVRCGQVTELPHSPDLIEGVMDLRGTMIPLVDLGRLLGHAGAGAGARSRVAIVEDDGVAIGLRIDGAVDVIHAGHADFLPLPGIAERAGYRLLSGVVRRPDSGAVLVLSLAAAIARIAHTEPLRGEAA